jgi:hypothetical protein
MGTSSKARFCCVPAWPQVFVSAIQERVFDFMLLKTVFLALKQKIDMKLKRTVTHPRRDRSFLEGGRRNRAANTR